MKPINYGSCSYSKPVGTDGCSLINPDGSTRTFIVTGCPVPDVSHRVCSAGHIYWTTWGFPSATRAIERGALMAVTAAPFFPSGVPYIPTQLPFFTPWVRKLYWS